MDGMGCVKMVQLSKRLTAVSDYVLPGGTLADIGTDHALLPTYLVQQGVIPTAVAGDVNPGPVLAAERQVRAAGLESRISVRAGNGLAVLRPGEALTITIAGMGGGTIVEILSSGGAALSGVQRLVLQPNIGERLVREWLLSQGWKLVAEQLLEEDGLLYEVLIADAASKSEADAWNEALFTKTVEGFGPVPRSVLLLLGPYLLDRPTPLFHRKWSAYVEKAGLLIAQMEKSDHPEAKAKREEFARERKEISEVLACLSKSARL
jgi:tRNA (adenine22-N1)-methyltransferase